MAPPSGPALEIEVRVWGYSLEDIPDKHLPACFRRAFKRKVDDFMLKASAVTREWVDMKEELVALETVNRDHILMLPAPKGEAMLHSEWRERHKAKYPDGCDLRYCVECYRPLREAGAWPEGPHWLQGAVPPPAHEDVSEFGKRRRELVEQVDTVDEDEDEDDLDF